MAHRVILVQNGQGTEVTGTVGDLQWSSSTDALGVECSFRYAFNDSRYFKDLDILNLGDQIWLYNDTKLLHKFVIVRDNVTGRFGKDYNCFDFSWYMNKNKTVIQFNKISASNAIKKLLDKFGIMYDIVDIPTLITKIYKGDAVSDIVKDILDQATQETGVKYVMEMDVDTLFIKKQSELIINPMVSLSTNTSEFPAVNAISNVSHKRTIEDMKNKVQVVSNNENATNILAETSDQNKISQFGLLTEVVTVDEKNESQARNIARNTLSSLNKIADDISLDLLGHDDIRAGRILEFNEPVTGVIGKYLIKSAKHSVNNGIHRVSVVLGVV